MSRDFPKSVKEKAKESANNTCQICGLQNELHVCHIVTSSLKPAWMRRGTQKYLYYDNIYVKSLDNAIVLCKNCHHKVDHNGGLDRYPVDYLRGLKINKSCCTYYTFENGRCKNKVYPRCREHNENGSCTIL